MNMHEIQKKKKTKQNKTIKVKIKSLSDSVSVINLPVSECLRKKIDISGQGNLWLDSDGQQRSLSFTRLFYLQFI